MKHHENPSFSSSASTRARPNLILVLADDYGWNDIGYNNPTVLTPTLDNLAKSGIKFESYYTHYVCSPTR